MGKAMEERKQKLEMGKERQKERDRCGNGDREKELKVGSV